MVKYSCETCLWYDHQHSSLKAVPENFGYCRKHKPVVYMHEEHYYGGWLWWTSWICVANGARIRSELWDAPLRRR